MLIFNKNIIKYLFIISTIFFIFTVSCKTHQTNTKNTISEIYIENLLDRLLNGDDTVLPKLIEHDKTALSVLNKKFYMKIIEVDSLYNLYALKFSDLKQFTSNSSETLLILDKHTYKHEKNIDKLLSKLANAKPSDRNKYEKIIINMGSSVIPFVKRYLNHNSKNPDITMHCKKIITACEENQIKRMIQALKLLLKVPRNLVEEECLNRLYWNFSEIIDHGEKTHRKFILSISEPEFLADFLVKTSKFNNIMREFDYHLLKKVLKHLMKYSPDKVMPVLYLSDHHSGLIYDAIFKNYGDKLTENDWKNFLKKNSREDYSYPLTPFANSLKKLKHIPEPLLSAIASCRNIENEDSGWLYLMYYTDNLNTIKKIWLSSDTKEFQDTIFEKLQTSNISPKETLKLLTLMSLKAFRSDYNKYNCCLREETISFLIKRIKKAKKKDIRNWINNSEISYQIFKIMLTNFPDCKKEIKHAAYNYLKNLTDPEEFDLQIKIFQKKFNENISKNLITSKWHSLVKTLNGKEMDYMFKIADKLKISKRLQVEMLENPEKINPIYSEGIIKAIKSALQSNNKKTIQKTADVLINIELYFNKIYKKIYKENEFETTKLEDNILIAISDFNSAIITPFYRNIILQNQDKQKSINKTLIITAQELDYTLDYYYLLKNCFLYTIYINQMAKNNKEKIINFIKTHNNFSEVFPYIAIFPITGTAKEYNEFLKNKLEKLLSSNEKILYKDPDDTYIALLAGVALNIKSEILEKILIIFAETCGSHDFYLRKSIFPETYYSPEKVFFIDKRFSKLIPTLIQLDKLYQYDIIRAKIAGSIDPDNPELIKYLTNILKNSKEWLKVSLTAKYLKEIGHLPPLNIFSDEKLNWLASEIDIDPDYYKNYESSKFLDKDSSYEFDDNYIFFSSYAGRNEKDDLRLLNILLPRLTHQDYFDLVIKLAKHSEKVKNILLNKIIQKLKTNITFGQLKEIFYLLGNINPQLPDSLIETLKVRLNLIKDINSYSLDDFILNISQMGQNASFLIPFLNQKIFKKDNDYEKTYKYLCLANISPIKQEREKNLLILFKKAFCINANTFSDLKNFNLAKLSERQIYSFVFYHYSEFYNLKGVDEIIIPIKLKILQYIISEYQRIYKSKQDESYWDLSILDQFETIILSIDKNYKSEELFQFYFKTLKELEKNDQYIIPAITRAILKDIIKRYPERIPQCRKILLKYPFILKVELNEYYELIVNQKLQKNSCLIKQTY